MTRCQIDCAKLASVEALYAELARQLRLPAHFGANLDALFDSLTRDVPGPVEIVLKNAAATPAALRQPLAKLVATLGEAARERHDLSLKIEAI
ncbi:MAG: barstar family protein [Rhodospirillales bacterium]